MTNTYPVPEFIRGAKGAGWKIDPSLNGPRMKPGILEVPLDNECVLCGQNHSLAIRNHELAHAEITLDKHGRMPLLPPGLKNEYFQATEDARIWAFIHRSLERQYGEHYRPVFDEHANYLRDEDGGVMYEYDNPPALCAKEREKWEGIFARLDDKNRVLFMMAGGEADDPFLKSIVRNATPPEAKVDANTIIEIVDNAREMVMDDVDSIRSTYKAAAYLQRLLEPPDEKKKDPDPHEGSDPADESTAEKREERGESGEAREATPAEADEEKKKHPNRKREVTEGSDIWCEVMMETPPLNRQMDGRLISTYRSVEEGSYIRNPHRLYIDGKVFGSKRRIQGGGVLIDDSGSMGLGLDEILLIMQSCPGATIGVYSSQGGLGERCTGFLRIVARNGRVIDKESAAHTPGKGNGIDGPALRWLATLPFPRKVWVSDEQPTGARGGVRHHLLTECRLLVKQHNITVVNPQYVPREKLAEATANVLLGKQMLAGRSR